MKTDTSTFKAAELLARLAQLAPSISIETIWEHDMDCRDITKDCDMPEGTDPADWQAWQSEVKASAVVNGRHVSGNAYLGGTWEKYGDDPAQSNPEISGYLPQMIQEALQNLRPSLSPAMQAECDAALAEI
jgi:hypothetical protein